MRPLKMWLGAVALIGCSGGAKEPAAPARPAVDLAPPKALEPPPARVVYDLLANRALAEVHVASNLIVDGGSLDFWKYIDGGWKSNWYPGGRDGDRPVALLQGIAGVVRFPLDSDGDGGGGEPDDKGDLRLRFVARPAVAKQSLSLFLNEKLLLNLALDEGYKPYDVTLPRDRIAVGENAVRFHFRAAGTLAGRHTAAAIERLTVGPQGARDPGPAPRLGETYGLGGDVRRALAADLPARFSYYLPIPGNTRLLFHYGTQKPAAAVRFEVRATVDGKGREVLWSGAAKAGWQRAEVDLARIAGETARLDLIVRGDGGAFAEPRLIADTRPGARPKVKAAEHVLVWMVDTLRADRLQAFDPKSPAKTPALDQLAREATLFAQCTVQGNYSLPSHTSLLTGVLPSVHRMYEDKDRLAESLPMVSQVFQRAGFATAIFSSNGYISEKWGFRKGWDAYRNFIREEKPNSADWVWKAARPWLEEQAKAGKRTFMYLATVDPHVAYNPPEKFLREYWSKPYKGPIKPILTSQQLYEIKVGKLKPSDEDKRYLEALYNAEVTQNDATFRDVVADLKQLGLYDKTAIVVVSDHGDEFYDHGSVGHGHSLYEELVHVPLLVRYPPLFPEGKVVKDDVDLTDVYATLLDLAALDLNVEGQGESLVRLVSDDGPRMERPAESFHQGVLRSLRLGRWKAIIWGGSRLQLFDLAADPGEKKDLAASRPVALRAVRNVFAYQHAFGDKWRKTRWGVASDMKAAFLEDNSR